MSDRREIRKPMSPKVLLIASFWEGDKTQMKGLLKLIADLEPAGISPVADLLLVNRWDCAPMESSVIKYLARKFHIFTHESRRKGVGWPVGCNSLFFGAMEYLYSCSAEKAGFPRYKAAFMLEADSCPLHRNWLRHFSGIWDSFRGRVYVAGCPVQAPGINPHINGNCFISGDLKFLYWLGRKCSEPTCGWDYALAGDFRAWGAATIPGMAFRWKAPTMSDNELQAECERGVTFLHGVKDFSALDFSRRKWLT